MKSIRQVLSLHLLAGVFLLLTAAGAVLAAAIHARLVAEFDAALLAKARALCALTSREGGGIEVDYSGEHLPEFEDERRPEYFEIRLRGGMLVARSPRLRGARLPEEPHAGADPVFRNWRLPDGRAGRVVHVPFRPRVDPGEEFGDPEDPGDALGLFRIPKAIAPAEVVVVMTVARGRDELDAMLLWLYATLVAVVAVLLGAIALLVRRVTRRALRPIAEIDRQVTAIGPDALGQRVDLAAPPEELRTIIATINRLLERLQRAFERERRFSADVAHELRTPVSELRAASEVGGLWPDDPVATRQYFADVRDIAIQMETTVANLLTLASCENGALTRTRERVALDELARACWSRSAAVAAERGVACECRIGPDQAVRTDRRKLEMILQNLFANAAAHATTASVVRCTTAPLGDALELTIDNRAEGITREDLPHLADRFWRKDAARSATGHAGLGLAIVKALCDSLGIGLRFTLSGDDRFAVILRFGPEHLRDDPAPPPPGSVVAAHGSS